MRIYDPLYGTFELPLYLERLILAPEFRRLSEVRLININSPSLAALADTTRYSHTLGVLRLAFENPLIGLDHDQLKAFFAAIILHDTGTPPFAHLFEYFLKEQFNWHHETVVDKLLTGTHHQDTTSHQIHRGLKINFKKYCTEMKIDFDQVRAFVRCESHFSKLIFGSLDFDNIDNVARMGVMLGFLVEIERFINLAHSLSISPHGSLILPEKMRSDVDHWAVIRRKSYDVLAFDQKTIAGQAVLSSIIKIALKCGVIGEDDWAYTDNEFISALSREKRLESMLTRHFFGHLPHMVLVARFADGKGMELSRAALESKIEEFLAENLPKSHVRFGYVFEDRGTFEKRLDFMCPDSGESWSCGETSRSRIVYGFVGDLDRRIAPELVGQNFLEWIN